MRPTRTRAFSGTLLVAALLISGCAATNEVPLDSSPNDQTTAPFAPVVLDNCGTTVTVKSPPTRVVTIKSTSTELLLALGLADRIVGTAFLDGPVPAEWNLVSDSLNVISDKVPSQEVILSLNPDFVFAGWESNLTADAAGERETLAKLGLQTYVSPAACKSPEYQPKKLSFSHIFDQFSEIGKIFDVAGRASELIEEQQAALNEIPQANPGTTALWYSSGPPELPYIGGGRGAPQMILDALGLENVASDVNDTWSSMSWESIAVLDPEVIVLVNADRNTYQTKISVLKAHPVMSQIEAVKQDRFLIIDFAAAEAGVRTVPATAALSKQLQDLDIP